MLGFALLLREEPGVKLLWTGPVSTLPERLRADFKVRSVKTVRMTLHEIKRETITRYELAKLASLLRAQNGTAGTAAGGAVPPLKIVPSK